MAVLTRYEWISSMRTLSNSKSSVAAALALSASLFLSACASSGDSPTGTPDEVNQIQAQLLGDMPLPAGARIVGTDSLIIGRGDNWVGRVVLNGLQTPTDIYAFFQSEYPKSGWTTVTAMKSKTSILVFTKGERTSTIEINEGSLTGPKSIIVITASPKNANVIAPSKR
jgi:hypothetical protein